MRQKKIRIAIIILSVLLALSLACFIGILIHKAATASTTAVVSDNILTQDAENSSSSETAQDNSETNSYSESRSVATSTNNTALQNTAKTLRLHNRNAEDNTPFKAGNMFPGDSETKYFCVRVSHKGDVILRFRADIRPGYERLAEVLCCRVVSDNGKVLYDGLMRDMPESLNHSLYTDKSTTSEVCYEITAYLDTSVGNEYMNKDLVADFRWWVEETENLDSPKTGDSSNIYLWMAIAAVSLFLLILLFKKRKKEDAESGQ